MKFEITIPDLTFNLESFIELLKRILDDIYFFIWGNKEEE